MSLVKDWAKDIFFPKFCVACQEAEGEWLCAPCQKKIAPPRPFFCLQPTADGRAYLDQAMALFDYGENTVSQLIKLLKYNYVTELAEIIAKIIRPENLGRIWRGYTIIPVPLHPRRERERGFNQAEIIAKIFAEKFGLAISNHLSRAIYTTQQAKLSKEARQKNLKDAFAFNAEKTTPEKVLLVDDVFTTGATMQECAKVLKSGGVKIVCGLALASGG